MQGRFFVHIAPGVGGASDRVLIKTGVVGEPVGTDRWLLEFDAKGYKFANVFRAEQLESFAFFVTPAARQSFIEELLASNAPAPVLTADPPAAAEVP